MERILYRIFHEDGQHRLKEKQDQTTDILTDELHPTLTPLKSAPIDEIRAHLIKSVSRHGK